MEADPPLPQTKYFYQINNNLILTLPIFQFFKINFFDTSERVLK